jgi:putative ABC transport system ATP-binding protein
MEMCKTIGLSKIYYKNDTEIKAINNCDLEIKAGECIAVCGSKDSGKTTLLRILSGIERPTEGSVFIKNQNIAEYSDDELAIMRRKEIGYLVQNDSLIHELTVHENIIMPAILAHIKYDEVYYQNLLGHLNLKEILSYKPRQLTDHQRQSVLYARALINNPSLILVDEPDNKAWLPIDKSFLDYLLNMVYMYGKTLIMVTEDDKISIFIDHIIRLDHGDIIENKRIS